ncbi:MAG: zinc metalloprotease HtpX [Bdellovibrio bacteriovorus]
MDRERLQRHKRRNALQQLGLLALLALLLGYIAWVIGGPAFVSGTLIGVLLLYLANPVASPRLVLGLYGARALTPRELPQLYVILKELAERAGLPRMPRLYYIPTRVMNAFATGRPEDAAVVLSDGLLRRLDLRELTGVLAHEVSHVANGDILVMSFADTVSRITGLLGLLGQVLLVANIPLLLLGEEALPMGAILVLLAGPTLSALVQLALSRNRELEADRSAAELSGDPAGLALALDKLERHQGRFWEQMMLPGRGLPDPSLLRTHPPTEERIARLLDLVPASPRVMPGDGLGRPGLGALPRGIPRSPRWHLGGLWY